MTCRSSGSRMVSIFIVLKAGGSSIFKKDMWRATRILLTCTLEESTKHGVETHDMQYLEMIWAIRTRIDLNHWINLCHGPLDAEYTWQEVSISSIRKSKEGGALSFEIVKCETAIQSELLIKGEHGPLI
jgi:hypothetical protein